MSKAELKTLKKQGILYNPEFGGIPTTTCNFDPRSEDEAKAKTGARSAEVMVDLDVTDLNRGPERKTKANLPEYSIQGNLTRDNILHACPVNPRKGSRK